jgi:hypothetical protein
MRTKEYAVFANIKPGVRYIIKVAFVFIFKILKTIGSSNLKVLSCVTTAH